MNTSYKTMEQNTIKYMLQYVEEYESIKAKEHKYYKTVRDFFKDKDICFQNFYKFYSRYVSNGRNAKALLPMRRGPKPKYQASPIIQNDLEQIIIDYRSKGYNKLIIAESLKKDSRIKKPCSASTIYRILKKYGYNKLTTRQKELKQRYVREYMGSLGHVDCHFLPKGVIKSAPERRYYVLGCMDDASRLCWVEVMESTKAIDATFAMMDVIMIMNQRYGISFEELLTDNGSEFCGGVKTMMEHPFERLLLHFGITHRRTKPYRPQTNGKIERFWRTFEEDVIDGAVYNNLDELKESVLGYNLYYNEHRPHQSLNGKKPIDSAVIKN